MKRQADGIFEYKGLCIDDFQNTYSGDHRVLRDGCKLRGLLNASQKDTLRNAQLGWIANRDNACMSAPTTVNVDCALNMTRSRADFLSARVVECQSVGCATSKLDDY